MAQGWLLRVHSGGGWHPGALNRVDQGEELCFAATPITTIREITFVSVASGYRQSRWPQGFGRHEVMVGFTGDEAVIIPRIPIDSLGHLQAPSPGVLNSVVARRPAPVEREAVWAERRSIAGLMLGQSHLAPGFQITECRDADALVVSRTFKGLTTSYEFVFEVDGRLRSVREMDGPPSC
jgi:hypothetical protein